MAWDFWTEFVARTRHMIIGEESANAVGGHRDTALELLIGVLFVIMRTSLARCLGILPQVREKTAACSCG